jgi:site-specific recombinase XerD
MSLSLWRRPDGRSDRWYIIGTYTVWRDGKPRTKRFKPKSTKTADRAEAEGILLQVAGRIQQGNIENRDAPKTFSGLVKAYLDGGGSGRYLVPVIQALGDVEVPSLTQALIDSEGRKAYPAVAPPTLRRQWHGVINAVLHHSKIHLELTLPEASQATTRWCFPAQAEAIIHQCAAGRFKNPWAPAMAELLFGAGCRSDEAFRLEACDLSLDYAIATFRDTKNGDERIVPLPHRTVAALARLPNIIAGEPGPVFRKAGGKPYADKTANEGRSLDFLRSAAKRAGLERFNPHMTRHTWATWFYCETKDALRLKLLGGWRTDSAMQRYTHLVPPKVGLDAIALGWDFRERMIEAPAEERKEA